MAEDSRGTSTVDKIKPKFEWVENTRIPKRLDACVVGLDMLEMGLGARQAQAAVRRSKATDVTISGNNRHA